MRHDDVLSRFVSSIVVDFLVYLLTILCLYALESSGIFLKVLLTSRHDDQISGKLSNFPRIEINSRETARDMELYIYSVFDQFSTLRKLPSSIKDAIKGFLRENANGLFMWVNLTMEELKTHATRLTKDTICRKLESAPVKLTEIYNAIINEVEMSRRDDLWRIMRWMVYGKRPLTFTELKVALCFELQADLDEWYDSEADIRHLCKSLLSIEDDRIYLVHQTARDFIQNYSLTASVDRLGGIVMGPRAALDVRSHLIQLLIPCVAQFPLNDT
jgi:hypothetical protein